MSYEIVPPSRRDGRPRPERPVFDERPVSAEIPVRGTGPLLSGGETDEILRRYLLTRALGASIVRTVYWVGVGLLAVVVLLWLVGLKVLAVPIGIVAIVVLLLRRALMTMTRRISGVDRMGSGAARVERLVGRTRKGLHAELGRIGLPSVPWGPLLVALRLLRPLKRGETVRRLARFDLSQVVPTATLDELHLILGLHR
jgi:hypothetical protein